MKILDTLRQRFQPAIISPFKEGYSLKTFFGDLSAGLIVGVVAIPLAIAFAIASGVTPEAGLATAVIAGFIISALGGSRVQIGGPTGAFIVIIYGIVQQFGTDGLMVATLMAGAILILLGLCGLGSIIKYIPYPVTIGFTSGIALIIFTGQVNDILGLGLKNLPADFVGKLTAYAGGLDHINGWSLLLSALTIVICFSWHRVTAKIPGSLIAILLTTAICQLFHLNTETIGSNFPSVAGGMTFPRPHLPSLTFSQLQSLVSPAIAIALLAGIESLLSAVVADGMTGRRHHSNTELIAQGLANIASPLFGGIPATGAIARTATNIRNGGKTPLAGIIHTLVLLAMMLFLGRYAAMIPMATLGGIIAVVAYNMSEWHLFKGMFKSTGSDIAVMLITFTLTVFVDLTVAIQAGVLLAAFTFIRRMARSTGALNVTGDPTGPAPDNPDDLANLRAAIPPGVEIYEVYGALFFGAADKFKDTLLSLQQPLPRVLILRMRYVIMLDASALHTLEDVQHHTQTRGVQLLLSGVRSQPLILMERSGFLARIGQDNVFGHIDEALARAREIVEKIQPPPA